MECKIKCKNFEKEDDKGNCKNFIGYSIIGRADGKEFVLKESCKNRCKYIDNKLEKNITSIIEFATQLRNVGSIIPFENIVKKDSVAVGKSIGELNFWHNTKATIIAVKRDGDLFLSPGPYFIINTDDIIVYVGDDSVLENVKNYIDN